MTTVIGPPAQMSVRNDFSRNINKRDNALNALVLLKLDHLLKIAESFPELDLECDRSK